MVLTVDIILKDKILSTIKAGDWVICEFGHNDEKEKGPGSGAWYHYSRNLKIFIDNLLKANGTCLKRKGNYMLFGKYNSLLSFLPLFSMCGYRTSLTKDCRGDYRLNI